MHLDKNEEKILSGEEGYAKKKAMEILTTLGEIYDADKLIPIESAQISGVSYKTIGDAGITFLEDISNAQVSVPTTINPAGMDLKSWKELGFPEEFARKQKKIISLYQKMGAFPECSCTPYLVGNVPKKNDHLAWSESSAVSYANSVLGAKTNREGGPSALASAILGKTPNFGYHLKKNRSPDIGFKVNVDLNNSEFGSLGKITGRIAEDKVPYFKLTTQVDRDKLKMLGAAMAATGAVALYHIEDVTPEASDFEEPNEFEVIEKEEIEDEFSKNKKNVDLVALGCPHLSIEELNEINSFLKNKELEIELWLFVARSLTEDNQALIEEIKKKNAKVVSDTCMVVSPLKEMGYSKIMVNSGKASSYLPTLGDLEVVFSTTKECLEVATGEN